MQILLMSSILFTSVQSVEVFQPLILGHAYSWHSDNIQQLQHAVLDTYRWFWDHERTKGCRKILHLMDPNKKSELCFLSNVNISSRSRLTQNWLDFLSHLGVQSNDPIVFKCVPHCNHNLHGIYPIKSYCLDSISITPSDSPERSFSASFPFWNRPHQFIWKYFSSWNNGKCLWNSFEHSVIVTYLDLTSTSEGEAGRK